MDARQSPSNGDAVTARYQSLLAVTESISSHTSLRDLFTGLPGKLRPLVTFDAVAVVLHDNERDRMRLHVFEAGKKVNEAPIAGETGPVDMSPEGIVWQTQQPMLITPVSKEKRFPEYIAHIRAEQIETLYSIPLTASGRRLGAITFGSARENAYSENDLHFLRQVAKQVAVAVDSVINLEAAARERDRKQLLLEIGEAVVSKLNLGDLFRTVSSHLRRIINHDSASVVLINDKDELVVHTLHQAPSGILSEGMILPMEGTPPGLCIRTRKTIRRDRIDFEEFPVPQIRMAYAAGLRCGCSAPLISHDQVLGAINIGSFHEFAFTQEDADLLEQIAAQLAIAVENALNFQRAERERDRNQLLLEVAKAVTSKLSLGELLRTVSACLRQFIKHDFASVVLRDDESGQLRVHGLDAPVGGLFAEGALLPIEGTPVGYAITTRKTLWRDRIDFEEFPAPQMRIAYAGGLRSGCCVPLISHGEVLGGLNVGSNREAAFTGEDVKILEEIAGQVAIAVENTLNFQRAEHERDRVQLLLKINNAVTSHLNLRDLLGAISDALRDVIKHDIAGLALYDEKTDSLRVRVLEGEPEIKHVEEGFLIPLNASPAAVSYTTRQPLIVDRLSTEDYPSPVIERAVAAGIISTCNVPLRIEDHVLGAMFIGSRQEAAFTQKDADLLAHVSAQVAIAVQNSVNFEEATRERKRVKTLLEINNAISTNLDIKDLVRATSDSLRSYFDHDVFGLTLYDAERKQMVTNALDLSKPADYLLEGSYFPVEGTLNGLAFTTGKAVVRHQIQADESSWPLAQKFFAEQGVKSYYWVPLLSHGRAVGVLNMGSRKEHALTDQDVELLQHIGAQIAIAVENSTVYQELAMLKNKLASEKLYLEEEIRAEHNFSEIVGQSAALKKILQQVATVAPTDSAVLLCGETGTGKELIARAIHNLSNRQERTLVKLNCAAIPTGLLESELFGHEKGAFTGAIASRVGRFELAHKGTLLLDEIGEISLELQPKLLRVLQEQEFERLGSSRTVKTDVRLIAATNVDLPQMVADKKFRSDLYYRLNVFPIIIPPLRERTGDIPLLVGYFTQKHALRMNKRIQTVSKETVDSLCTYSWPGNVRELENFVERAVILTTGSELQAPLSELGVGVSAAAGNGHDSPGTGSQADDVSRPVTLEDVERAHILEILKQTRGVIGGKGGAAEILGLPISTLRNRMKKLGLK